VVGFKPSIGRISTAGVIPLSPALDHVGLFSHYVELIARALPLLVNLWQPVTKSFERPFLAIPVSDYLEQSDSEMQEHFWHTIDHLKSKGYSFKEINPFEDLQAIVKRNNIILAAQAAQVHVAWHSAYKHLYHPKTAELIEKGLEISDTALDQALFEQRQFRLDLSTLMDIHGIKAWISPATRGAAPRGIASTGDPIMNLPWTQAGFPTVCLPSGMNSEEMPFGLQITADFNRDEDLINWASDIENALAVTA
jgi:Asp-tRNA(Asn)/Glu-tRNA(Gln) amidotransferase A subunit family amidase